MFDFIHDGTRALRNYTVLFTDYLNKVTDWLSHLDYSSLGWELLVLAAAGALLVHRTLGRFLPKTSSELDARHIKRITLRSVQLAAYRVPAEYAAGRADWQDSPAT